MRSWLRLVRAPLAPTAACDAAACLLLARGAGGEALEPLGAWDWALLAATSLLVYAFGMGLNDWADRARDRTLAPDRPLPSGALAPAPVLVVLGFIAAGAVALGGGPAGARGMVVAALAAAALYDLGLKHALVGGAVAMGSVRALQAGVGVVPLVASGAAPAWVLVAPLAVGTYSAGITVLSTTEEVPSPRRRVVARVLAGVAHALAGTAAVIAAGRFTFGVLLALASVLSLAFARVPRPGPVKRQVLEMLLGLYLLAAILAGGSGNGIVEVAALGVAFLLVLASQLAIRALRPR